jgi:hypothetical protein
VTLTGHLTVNQLTAALTPVVSRTDQTTEVPLLFDCLHMTGYDTEARERFVEWHKKQGKQITRVAILTTNPIWSVVIAAMALASGHSMKAFSRRAEAESWLTTQALQR